MSRGAQRFTAARRTAWLSLVEAGSTQVEANTKVGVSKATVASWVKRGRAATEGEHFEFAARLDALPKAKRKSSPQQLVNEHSQGNLSQAQLVGLLERAAGEQLNVQAIRLLLERTWEKDANENQKQETSGSILDELQARRERRG